MTKVLRCQACGAATVVPTCPSCGAELAGAVDARDQTWSDEDQTTSDRDQTWSDHDQTGSDSDQRSADEDQRAADSDFASGGDAVAYHRTALARGRTSEDRAAVAALRDVAAAARFRTAEERDRAAALRDRGAEGRDALARLHDQENDAEASREDLLSRARRDRARAAADRAKAADDRTRAAADRGEAARDRAEFLRHRSELADNLELATTDELTGARTRKLGLEEVARELERANRMGTSLVLAFVDVDDLKRVNDTQGHLAGDALLELVGQTLRANVRPYDLIVRYGGDELLCAMPSASAHEARARFDRIAAALRATDADYSIAFGLAEAEPAETLRDLIARADAALLEARRSDSSVD